MHDAAAEGIDFTHLAISISASKLPHAGAGWQALRDAPAPRMSLASSQLARIPQDNRMR